MLDNLRRSLAPPALLLALFVGWLLPNIPAMLLWIGFVLLTIALPPIVAVLPGIVPRREQTALGSHFQAVLGDLRLAATQVALVVTLLADQAWLMLDAIVRTLVRLSITRRNLLEWTSFDQARALGTDDVLGHYVRMPGTLVAAAITAALPFAAAPEAWAVAAPFALLWLAAPAIAWWISRSAASGDGAALVATDVRALRMVARRTWRYFETFVTAADNMLPPDNFQEDPKPVVARRTSPTNIGLYLLSIATAREFGWISLTDAIERLEATFATLGKLERVNGHFLNWYDTAELRPLTPKYVSSVDSGNLAGHLIALANTCEAWVATSPLGAWKLGLADTVALARATARQGEAAAAPDRRAGERSTRRCKASHTGWPNLPMPGRARRSSGLRRSSRQRARCATPPPPPPPRWPPTRWPGPRLRILPPPATRARRTCWLERPPRPSRRHSRRSRPPQSPARAPPAKAAPARWNVGCTRWRPAPAASPRRCASTSCSIPTASCCRSASWSATRASTRTATTCSPRRRGWRVFWPLPAATCRWRTGSGWGGR